MKKAKWTFILTLALVLAMSAAAFAQMAPVAPAPIPLDPKKIPQFVNNLDQLLAGIPVVVNYDPATPPYVWPKTNVDLSLCEFKTQILPTGTLGKNVTTTTSVWGYIEGPCPGQNTVVNHSYLGPAVVAVRDTPTQMNYYNKLPLDVNQSNVNAYKLSTDTTLIWGDPLSLNTAPPPINLLGLPNPNPQPPLYNPNYDSELNLCWLGAQNYVAALGTVCGFNYGTSYLDVTVPQPWTAVTYPAPVPAAVHIHGGEVPSVLDGGPDAWWTQNGIIGHGYYTKGTPAEVAADIAAGKATYVYPNKQEAAPIWFHDHMLGATRLNVYAGIAGAYVLIDPDMPLAQGLHPLGVDTDGNGSFLNADHTLQTKELTIPLIIQDRMFDTTGQLYFPNLGINLEHPYWVPEFVGDAICVNGKAWPNLNVEPRRYKFLFLNGSNARSYELFLINKVTGVKGPMMYVIGNDQGYLNAPELIDPNAKLNNKLTMMPGERYEVIIDFSGFAAGTKLLLSNTARTPWVGGAPVNGGTTGRIMQFTVGPAMPTGFQDKSLNPAAAGARVRANDMVRMTVAKGTAIAPGVKVDKLRRLTLNEVIAAGGPLEILVNNTLYDGSKVARTDFTPIDSMWNTSYYTELPHEGETEIWEIINLTADAHPMHPHLVAFQVLNRQALDLKAYTAVYNAAYVAQGLVDPVTGLPLDGAGPPYNYNNSGNLALDPITVLPLCSATAPLRGDANYVVTQDPLTGALSAPCVLGGNPDPAAALALIGAVLPPAPQEIGWKDTVQALPNMVTRILVRFAKADLPANTPAAEAGYDFDPNHGHGYVWHCHIVDHEDNEMMRPYTVQTNTNFTHTFIQGDDY